MYPGSGQALRLDVAFMTARCLTPSGSDLLYANRFERRRGLIEQIERPGYDPPAGRFEVDIPDLSWRNGATLGL